MTRLSGAISVRVVLVALGFAFTAYLAARGLWWTDSVPEEPVFVFLALGLYLATTWLCLFWEPRALHDADATHSDTGSTVVARGRVRLPMWAAGLALASAIIVPNAISYAVGDESRAAPYATWYLGGVGALMTIVMVRRRPWIAWIGIAALAVSSMTWLGPANALGLGLVGSVVWVVLAQLLQVSTDRAARDANRLAALQRAASAWQAAQSGRQRERRVQVQRALAVAGPVLTRVIATGARLDDDEKLQARIAEGTLRDELRGPRLLDDDVRAALATARRRGATVTVLDEGGLDGMNDVALADIRAQLAATLKTALSDRLFIRTAAHDTVAVTVVGRSGSHAGLSDEDAVDLWQEILRTAD